MPARTAPRYDMLAIDLDGTLLDSSGGVSAANRDAVRRARAAGLAIVVCTGRGLAESERAIRAIEQVDPVVVAGGAMIACPASNRTLHRFPIGEAMVRRATEILLRAGHAALILKDGLEAGYDYLIVRGEPQRPLHPVTDWWIREMRPRARFVRTLDEDEHPEHTIRVGACGPGAGFIAVREEVARGHDDRLVVRHFEAVTSRAHVRDLAPGETLDVFEVFDKRAGKWAAIEHFAAERGIQTDRIAAIGDQINDMCMIGGAALGVAMGNACEEVRVLADRHAPANDEDGVAFAIDRILSGAW